jgi:hypothetical protein
MRQSLALLGVCSVIGFSIFQFMNLGDRLKSERYGLVEEALLNKTIGLEATELLERVVELIAERHPEARRISVNRVSEGSGISLVIVDYSKPEVLNALRTLGIAPQCLPSSLVSQI